SSHKGRIDLNIESALRFPARCDPHGAAENEDDNGVAKEIVPAIYRGQTATRRDPDQGICAQKIGDESNGNGACEQEQTVTNRETFYFTEKQPDHEGGLERADAAACFTHADNSVRESK